MPHSFGLEPHQSKDLRKLLYGQKEKEKKRNCFSFFLYKRLYIYIYMVIYYGIYQSCETTDMCLDLSKGLGWTVWRTSSFLCCKFLLFMTYMLFKERVSFDLFLFNIILTCVGYWIQNHSCRRTAVILLDLLLEETRVFISFPRLLVQKWIQWHDWCSKLFSISQSSTLVTMLQGLPLQEKRKVQDSLVLVSLQELPELVLISFPSPRLVILPRLESPVCHITIYQQLWK